MPFAGDVAAARAAVDQLLALNVADGDELILSDNSGVAGGQAGVAVVRASGEASAAHARNVGAARAGRDWILFLDADVEPEPGLIDAYFAVPVSDRVGALAGVVVPAGDPRTLAERYGAAKNFLGQDAHLAHPYLPRAVAANLLVRRTAFEQLGGFAEGVRAGEDTDFSWRLQQAGWLLEPRGAVAAHRYRATVRELRRQWRGYAAGRAWLARRYPDFHPEPALVRALRRRANQGFAPGAAGVSPRDRLLFYGLDVILGFEELIGLRMSNRARRR
jgi:GT2 family glycosyltransferase